MAVDKRTYPNDYFAWYNDDSRVAIICEDKTTEDIVEKTRERYDTYQGEDVSNGIRLTVTSRFGYVSSQSDDLKTNIGLDTGLHSYIICYLKARLFEDVGDIEKSQYFRAMYEKMMKQYPSRKSGLRHLSVPRL